MLGKTHESTGAVYDTIDHKMNHNFNEGDSVWFQRMIFLESFDYILLPLYLVLKCNFARQENNILTIFVPLSYLNFIPFRSKSLLMHYVLKCSTIKEDRVQPVLKEHPRDMQNTVS